MDTVKEMEQTVADLVDKILSEKEQAGVEVEIEEALKTAKLAVENLSKQLIEAKEKQSDDAATIEELESKLSDMEAESASVKDELKTAKNELDKATETASNVSNELTGLKKDMKLKDRLSELAELEVIRKGDALKAQTESVRNMSEEEYASYKVDLVAFRDEVMEAAKALYESKEEIEEPKLETEETASDEGNDGNQEGADEGAVETPPADIEGAQETASVVIPGEENDKSNKWKVFSEGLTGLMRGGDNS